MRLTKEDKALIHSLLIIRNKASCEYTHWRAVQEYYRTKYALAKRIGEGPIIYLGHELLDIDPLYLDGGRDKYSVSGFGETVNSIICHIAPQKEALKYMKEYRPLSHYYDNFKGWGNSSWTSVDACYEHPWEEVRHDTEVLEKWRKYNG